MTDYHRSDRSEHAGPTFSRPAQDNHEEIDRARLAAEALFTPKPRTHEPSTPTSGPSTNQAARRPRVLSAVPTQPKRDEPAKRPAVSVRQEPIREIPASHLSRIRAWLKYGMTIPQVAKVYGVTIGDIESMLQGA